MKIKPTDALVVVDVQNDFCPGGALAVNGGDEIVPIVNRLASRFQHRAFTRDWHPANHCSFDPAPRFVDGSWPAHCVQDTPGAQLHPALDVSADAIIVSKGTHTEREAYSGFDQTAFADDLRRRRVKRLFVCGIATDYCVKATALDGVQNGFDVVLVEDACRGVDIPPGSAADAVAAMRNAGITVICSEDIE